jgi:hypothetical protein
MMTNFAGIQRDELRALAAHSANPKLILAARDEIVRRELECETDERTGRRKMGGDLGARNDEQDG